MSTAWITALSSVVVVSLTLLGLFWWGYSQMEAHELGDD